MLLDLWLAPRERGLWRKIDQFLEMPCSKKRGNVYSLTNPSLSIYLMMSYYLMDDVESGEVKE